MTDTTTTLESTIGSVEEKADQYETATNFEAKKQEYLKDLESIESSLRRLKQRVDRMEFLTAVLVDVLETRSTAPSEVDDARSRVRKLVDHDADYYYELVDGNDGDEYTQRVQQTQTAVKQAIEVVKRELDKKEATWMKRVDAARNVQRLFGDAKDMSKTFNEIETFVQRRMKDDSESISSLKAKWQGLKKSWDRSGADWDTFQAEYGLSDRTIELLQELATGKEVKLRRLDESTMSELLSVDDLQDVAKLTI